MAKITYRYDRTVHKIPKELRTLHLGTAAVPSKPRKARITYNGVPLLPLRRCVRGPTQGLLTLPEVRTM